MSHAKESIYGPFVYLGYAIAIFCAVALVGWPLINFAIYLAITGLIATFIIGYYRDRRERKMNEGIDIFWTGFGILMAFMVALIAVGWLGIGIIAAWLCVCAISAEYF